MTTRNDRSRAPIVLVLLAAIAAVTASCIDGDEPFIVEPASPLFERYVSLGNSITAGYQSSGIVDSTQQQAYPVLLAAKANARFGIPSLTYPGCPPPLAAPLTTERISTTPCALRSFDMPDLVQNLAVPGFYASHPDNPAGNGTIITTLILGGRTQLGAMAEADPTLVSVWLGNMDALIASGAGDTLLLTPQAAFESEYAEIVDAINDTDAQEAILIGVVDAIEAAPLLQYGAYFWALPDTLVLSATDTIFMDVQNDCAPSFAGGLGSSRYVSFSGVQTAIAAGERPVTISCVDGVEIGGAYQPGYLLDETEQAVIQSRVQGFNSFIAQQAADNGWIYVDPGAILGPALADADKIRKCQGLPQATGPTAFGTVIQTTCPGFNAPNFFGSFITFDGTHPSILAHQAVADTLAGRLNEAHGSTLPVN